MKNAFVSVVCQLNTEIKCILNQLSFFFIFLPVWNEILFKFTSISWCNWSYVSGNTLIISVFKKDAISLIVVNSDLISRFLYDLSQIPDYDERIFCFIFQSTFQESISGIENKLNNLKMTCEVRRIFIFAIFLFLSFL